MVYMIDTLAREFHKLGATILFETRCSETRISETQISETRKLPFSVGVRADQRGESLFALTQRDDAVRFRVVDIDRRTRKLLLLVSQRGERLEQVMYLCGRSDQGWFVTQLPALVETVAQAEVALN